MTRTALILALAAILFAGDPPAAELPPDAVAVVGGQPITVATLASELLQREGADEVLQWVGENLDAIDWSALPDDGVVMSVGGHQLRKRELLAMLLRSKGAQVREELISIAVVEQALTAAGVVRDDALMAGEYRLLEREFQRKRVASGQGYIDFASYLRVKEKQNADQFMAQPAVRMLAGLHELVRRRIRAEWDDAKLSAKLEAERARWDQRAGVDLSTIFIPWKKDEHGKVTDEEKVRLQGVVNLIWHQIQDKQTTFERAWEVFGRGWDASGPGGRVGWVDSDGKRDDQSDRRIPAGVVQRAFAYEGQLPVLLPPHAHEGGVDLALLHAKRPGRTVTLAEVRERLLADIFENELEQRTKEMVTELRKSAKINYASLPDLIRRRLEPATPPAPAPPGPTSP